MRSVAAFLVLRRALAALGGSSRGAGIAALATGIAIFSLAATGLPLVAADTVPAQTGAGGGDFGQYLADHQADLAPFFVKNAGDFFKLGIPVLMGIMGWVLFFTFLAGWGIDILLSRGFAFFFAPAFTDLKRSVIYATGRLFLSFVYTFLLSLAIVLSLKLSHPGIIMGFVIILVLVVALAAQIVWILYLYRTNFAVSALFCLAVFVVHSGVGLVIAKPVIDARASAVATDFVDRAVTPRLQAEAESTRRELAGAAADRDAVKAKADDLQHRTAQAQADAAQLRQEIEEKKNSDIYVFSRIIQAHARDELDSAHDQLTAFLAKFPSSSLSDLARAQLAQIDGERVAKAVQKKKDEAQAARLAAQARSDLLARAGKGEATLSEMRQALIGRSRAQVSNLLGLPGETASDRWGYPRRMILNPLTNEKYGLMVYFAEGIVQGVDYDQNGASQ